MILDVRLRAAADMVPRGARLADIGSDHAYLPIALCLENKIERALASDINEGPVAAAVANIQKKRLGDRIVAVKADGLDKTQDFHPDCITVLGMGGELIVSILGKAEWVKDESITLVLQPMTHPEILSKYLAANGFAVADEKVVCDGGRDDRIYRIICARFDGAVRSLTEAEALIGKINLERGDEVTRAYIGKNIRVLETRIAGRARIGDPAESEKALVNELKAYL
ncbi:MAG: SAM-dependent methyltransferase [Clostridia bacterium]|nr:SAM-dependent methyltransferase [Clostridia bacterium]